MLAAVPRELAEIFYMIAHFNVFFLYLSTMNAVKCFAKIARNSELNKTPVISFIVHSKALFVITEKREKLRTKDD